MNWQAKTRELLAQRHVSVDALGRAIGERGRSMRNWLKIKKPTKALNEVAVTQAIADYFGVDVLWLLDDTAEFPARPRAAAATMGQQAAVEAFMPPDVVRILHAARNPATLAFLIAALDALPTTSPPAAPPGGQVPPGQTTSAPRTQPSPRKTST